MATVIVGASALPAAAAAHSVGCRINNMPSVKAGTSSACGTADATVGGLASAGAAARTITVDAGALRAVIRPDPWLVTFVDRSGSVVLSGASGGGRRSAAGAVGFF